MTYCLVYITPPTLPVVLYPPAFPSFTAPFPDPHTVGGVYFTPLTKRVFEFCLVLFHHTLFGNLISDPPNTLVHFLPYKAMPI